MKNRITRRCAIALAFAPLAGGAFAQAWPAKPVTLVVPFPPGGTTDVLARAIGQKLGDALGQQVIVENKPGAGATLGAEHVAKARPDGYTLLMGAVHHTIAPSVFRRLGYDFQKDFAPVTVVAAVPNVLVVNNEVPARSVKELIALARAQPGKLAYGSNGNGTAQHLIGTQFENMAGVDLVHVPYKGSGPLTTDLIGGQIAISFDTVTPVLPHIRGGKLRALAVTTARRSAALPDVPTVAEAALPGFDLGSWFGILAPAATPKEVLARLHAEIAKALKSDDIKARFAEIGAEPVGNTPDEMRAQIAAETARFAKLVKDAKVAIE
jgi:tripartite-type tricarboxylate transporter receptor subunit TctC